MLHDAGLVTALLANWNSLLGGKLSVLLIMAIIIFTNGEQNCSGLPRVRQAFRLKGGKLRCVIAPVKFFLAAFGAGRVEPNA